MPADELEAAHMRIAELEAENARLRGEDPSALPAPESERVITPSESDIVPPGELGESYAGKRLTPDDHRVMRPKPVIEGTAEPVATVDGKPVPPGSKVVPGNWGTVSGDEAKARMARVNADRSLEHRIMTQPSMLKGEPQPSLGNENWRGHTWRYE